MQRCWGALFLLLASCAQDDPPGRFDDFDALVDSHLADEGLGGAVAVIMTEGDGILHMRGYGAFDPDRVILIASASKIVSAGVLMRLADEGLIDLDTPISEYLADWGEHRTDITEAQLLSNSSGMVGLVQNPLYPPYTCMYVPDGVLAECAETLYQADDAADVAPPDTEFRYGGGQWQLAGGLAEVVSGKTWAELIDETYGEPCGLQRSGYANFLLKATIEDAAIGGALTYPSFFTGDPAQLDPTDNPSVEGGMYTTASDYAQILLMHLRGGMCGDNRVLSEEAVKRMQVDRILEAYDGTAEGVDPSLTGYGMGWWIERDTALRADSGAYGAMPWLDPERRYGVVFLMEGTEAQGSRFRARARPVLEQLFP